MAIEMNTYVGHQMSATNDSILSDRAIPESGILHGCDMNFLGANQVHIEKGYMLIKGRFCTVTEENIQVAMSNTATEIPGRIYVRMDLADAQDPVKIMSIAADPLPELEQNESCNYENGVYELELATYTAGLAAITKFEVTCKEVSIMGKINDALDEVNARIERTETDINTMKSEIEEVKREVTSPSFRLNETIVIFGDGANTTLVPEWTGQSGVSVGQNTSGSGTIISSTSVDMRSVKSITAFQSMYNHPGCSSHNDYKYCGYIASYGIKIAVYDSTNTRLIKECEFAQNSCVLDVSDVNEMCYIRVTHQLYHADLGNSSSTITKVSLTV